jgi:tetratricopeptide (TPR) repeat protein
MKKLGAILVLVTTPLFAEQRIASDFEIARMKEQIARSRSFSSLISAHLNLGDAWLSRSERTAATAEYRLALETAMKERTDARSDSDLTRYARATSLGGLAAAKLSEERQALQLLDESIRYSARDAETWNVYASSMTVLRQPRKAVSAARNAVQIASEPLDVAVYRYTLASSLLDAGETDEAALLLESIITTLHSSQFDSLRKEIARSESFEIYSSARGDAAAYLSLLNRSQLRLAALSERRGDVASARAQYEGVLRTRSDDATALAGLARLTGRDEYFAAAFDANPFSLTLVREYQRSITPATVADTATLGGRVRGALVHIARGEGRAARQALDTLLVEFPTNDTLRLLREELEAEVEFPQSLTGTVENLRRLLALLRHERLTPDQRALLDRTSFTSDVLFADGTFESGTVAGVPFRFTEPTLFAGSFDATAPLRLTYRILGATAVAGADGLLLEPLKLEPAR